ncbi:hypothetical protein AFLA70_308g000860 [Aspergillus flavus AF70]|nr:hypothetical protein AFLA70_308g000860 [Aspergillus flavus AF70]
MDSRDIESKRSLKDLGSPTREPNAAEILSLGQASCDSGIPPLIPSLTRFLWIFLSLCFIYPFFRLPSLTVPLNLIWSCRFCCHPSKSQWLETITLPCSHKQPPCLVNTRKERNTSYSDF